MSKHKYLYDKYCIPIGTAVSAKFRGAFCEAAINDVEKMMKCVIQLDDKKTVKIDIENIISDMNVNQRVKFKNQLVFQSGILLKFFDDSYYHVVFNDDDTGKLKRNQIVIKGDRHYKESESLDKHPLTNPDHFIKSVISEKPKVRSDDEYELDDQKSCSQESQGTVSSNKTRSKLINTRSPSVVTARSSSITVKHTDSLKTTPVSQKRGKRKSQNTKYKIGAIGIVKRYVAQYNSNTLSMEKCPKKYKHFIGLIVSPTSTGIKLSDLKDLQIIVRSFQNDNWYLVYKRDVEIIKERDSLLKSKDLFDNSVTSQNNLIKCVLYMDVKLLPHGWSGDLLLNTNDNNNSSNNLSDISPDKAKLRSSLSVSLSSLTSSSSDDDNGIDGVTDRDEILQNDKLNSNSQNNQVLSEARDEWVARFYGFWEDKGSPINNELEIDGSEIDIYRLFEIVSDFGGYQKVTSTIRWPHIYYILSLPLPSTDRYQKLQTLYKKYIFPYVDMSKKLGTFEQVRSRHGGERENPTFKKARQQQLPRMKDKDRTKNPSNVGSGKKSSVDSTALSTSSQHSTVGSLICKDQTIIETATDCNVTIEETECYEKPKEVIAQIPYSCDEEEEDRVSAVESCVSRNSTDKEAVNKSKHLPIKPYSSKISSSSSSSSSSNSSVGENCESSHASSNNSSRSTSNINSSARSVVSIKEKPSEISNATIQLHIDTDDKADGQTNDQEVLQSMKQESVKTLGIQNLLPGTLINVSYGEKEVYKAKIVNQQTPDKTPTKRRTADSVSTGGSCTSIEQMQQQLSPNNMTTSTYYKVHYIGWNNRHDEIIPTERIVEVLSDTSQDNLSSCSSNTNQKLTNVGYPNTVAVTPTSIGLVVATASSTTTDDTTNMTVTTNKTTITSIIDTKISTLSSTSKPLELLTPTEVNETQNDSNFVTPDPIVPETVVEVTCDDISLKEVELEVEENIEVSTNDMKNDPKLIQQEISPTKSRVNLKRRRSKSACIVEQIYQPTCKRLPNLHEESRLISSLNLNQVCNIPEKADHIKSDVSQKSMKLEQREIMKSNSKKRISDEILHDASKPTISSSKVLKVEQKVGDDDNNNVSVLKNSKHEQRHNSPLSIDDTSSNGSTIEFRDAESESLFYLESDGEQKSINSHVSTTKKVTGKQPGKRGRKPLSKQEKLARRSKDKPTNSRPDILEVESTSSQQSGSLNSSRRMTRSIKNVSDQLEDDSQTSQDEGSHQEFQYPSVLPGSVPVTPYLPNTKSNKQHQPRNSGTPTSSCGFTPVNNGRGVNRAGPSPNYGYKKQRNSHSATSSTENNISNSHNIDHLSTLTATESPGVVQPFTGRPFQRIHPSLVPTDLMSLSPIERIKKLENVIRQTHNNFQDTKERLRFVEKKLTEIKMCKTNGHGIESDEDKFR